MNEKKFNRRQFLKAASLTAAGIGIAACTPQVVTQTQIVKETVQETVEVPVETVVEKTVVVAPTPTAVPPKPSGPVTLVFEADAGNWTDDFNKAWTAKNPNITIQRIDVDNTRVAAMFAAGSPPDVIRLNGVMLPNYCLRKMLLDIQPYIDTSSVIKMDDLAPCHGLMKWSGQTTGEGDLYGIVKDWSTEFNLWLYKPAFDKASIPTVQTDTPITYTDLAEIARKMTKTQGDKTITFGIESQALSWAFSQTIMECLAQKGETLFDDAFSKMILSSNPDAVEIVKYWFDLMKEGAAPSPVNPAANWAGVTMAQGQMAMAQYGYWYNGAVRTTDYHDGADIVYCPAPLWSGTTRRNPCAAATNYSITAKTKNPDATWQFFEWNAAEDPAIADAKTGWGIPALKSNYQYMPNSTEYDKRVWAVLNVDLPTAAATLKYNPFYDAQTLNSNVWTAQSQDALTGKITFDQMIKNIEDANNQAILDGINRIS
jgi:multiple sugar transport system substrate-binding protein